MSLRVWLPLNGNLQQLGCSNAIATNDGATVSSDGKIGSCYSFNNNRIIIDSTEIQSLFSSTTQPFSLTCWIYLNSDETDRVIVFGNFNVNPFINWELTASCVQRLCVGGISNYTTKTNTTAVPKITWTHIAVTYDGTQTTFYQNGTKTDVFSGANTLSTTTPASRFYLGGDSRTGVTRLKGRMNDFRLYDHCLSATEVHEISQGLITHYKLDHAIQPNLITGDLLTTSIWGVNQATTAIDDNALKVTITSSSGDRRIYRATTNVWTPANSTFTISFDARASTNGLTINASRSNIASDMISFSLTTEWKHYSGQIVNTAAVDGGTLSIRCLTNGGVFWIRNVKLERGNVETGFIIDNGTNKIIVDDSGYNYNAVIDSGVLELSSDTPRYNASLKVDGATKGTLTLPFTSTVLNPELTWCGWVKRTYTDAVATHIYNGIVLIYLHTNFAPRITWNHATSSSTAVNTWAPATATTANVWMHIAFTFKDGVMKYYVNGAYKSQSNRTETGQFIKGYYSNSIFANSVSNYKFTGQVSDMRIYATALSDADIKQLYEIGAKIDNKGQCHTYEFIEHQDNIIFNIEKARTDQEFKYGLSRYIQTNCQVTLTNQGYHIYRPPNLTPSANGNTMWGGLKLVNQTADTIAAYDASRDNSWGLQQGHTYMAAFHVIGQSSNSTSLSWTNNMGWGGGGVSPSPTSIANEGIPTNFQGEKDCFYIFTINDSISKTCTRTYSSYTANTTYLSYRHLTFGWDYTSTDTLGTDLYLTNFRLYDITSYKAQFLKTGIINFYDIVEQMNKCQIRKKSELLATNFIEL